jgi:hypothetical protein
VARRGKQREERGTETKEMLLRWITSFTLVPHHLAYYFFLANGPGIKRVIFPPRYWNYPPRLWHNVTSEIFDSSISQARKCYFVMKHDALFLILNEEISLAV